MKTICIICPMGCELFIEKKNGEIKVSGNLCPKGEEYGKTEYLNPKRILITVLPCKNGKLPVISVKTSKPIPKKLLKEAIKILSDIEINAPVNIGDVVVKNILNTGADVVVSRSC